MRTVFITVFTEMYGGMQVYISVYTIEMWSGKQTGVVRSY